MTFLHAGLLAAGLGCVAIPIVIHFFMRRRRKPVMWGAMRFLRQAYKKHRRRLMMEKWLLLAARCLVIALVAMAIGRPMVKGALGGAADQQEGVVYVLIDDGIAAGAVGSDGRAAIERHKERAAEVIGAVEGLDGGAMRVGLVRLAGPARGVVVPGVSDAGAVGRLIDEVRVRDARTDVAGGLGVVAEALKVQELNGGGGGRGRVVVVLLSDFLEGSAEVSEAIGALPDGVEVYAGGPVGAGDGEEWRGMNMAVAGIEPTRRVIVGELSGTGGTGGVGGVGGGVLVRLVRSGQGGGEERGVVAVRLLHETGEPVADRAVRTRVAWESGQDEAVVSVPMSELVGDGEGSGDAAELVRAGGMGGVIEARLESEGGVIEAGAVGGDDVRRAVIQVRETLRVAVAGRRGFGGSDAVSELDEGGWVRLALRPGVETGIEVSSVDAAELDVVGLGTLDAVVVTRPDLVSGEGWKRLGAMARGGGLVMVMPAGKLGVHTWQDAMSEALGVPVRVGREVVEHEEGAGIEVADQAVGEDGLLRVVGSEMETLARPVRVWKRLALEHEKGARQRLVTVGGGGEADDSTLVWVGRAGMAEENDEARVGGGTVVVFGVAMDPAWSDLVARPVMVPMMQELVRQGVMGAGRGGMSVEVVAGQAAVIEEEGLELVRVIGDQAGEPLGGEGGGGGRDAGVWRRVDALGATRGLVAVNPSVAGGSVRPMRREELSQWLGQSGAEVQWLDEVAAELGMGDEGNGRSDVFASVLGQEGGGRPMSLPLLVAALALAVVELGLARRASYAGVGHTSVGGGA